MEISKQLWDSESQLWKNDIVLYDRHTMNNALFAFPETGIITKEEALSAIRDENTTGRRWAEVNFEKQQNMFLSESAALITYTAIARWAHKPDVYKALCTSVYVKYERQWKLAFHQQSPLSSD
jgi:hypothetical protein